MKKYLSIIAFALLSLGCNSVQKQSKIMIIETPLLKSKATGYFQATGANSDWNLEISEEKIQFQSLEFEMNSPHIDPVRAMDANVKMYQVIIEKGEMEISIYQQKCLIQNSIFEYTYEVKVSIKNRGETKEYVGCGKYITDYRLYDLWALEEMEGKKVTVANFTKEIPLLEINSSQNSFSGYAGCNQITGKLFQERELLRFKDIVGTKMACSTENLEQSFLKALQSSTSYEIKDSRLYLSNPSGKKIIFKKVD